MDCSGTVMVECSRLHLRTSGSESVCHQHRDRRNIRSNSALSLSNWSSGIVQFHKA